MRGRFHCTPASAAGIFLLLTMAVTPTYAQEGGQLEEIVVTSQRRAESLQDVPLSVAAFGQADITRLAISSIDDITRLTPGLAGTNSGAYAPILSIHGIASISGAATTGIYIDDTPIQVRQSFGGNTSVSAYPSVFDLERIEVLRGPQGTLFGAGSEGGAVRFITPEPSLIAYSGHARAEFGMNDKGAPSYQFGGAYGGPLLTDTLGFRVSAYVQEDGGWIDRAPYPSPYVLDENINSQRTVTVNTALGWAATDSLTVTPKVFFQDQQSGGPPYYWRGLSNPGREDFIYGGAIMRPSHDQFALPSLKVEWRAGYVTLISNTSYMERKRTSTDDNTFVVTEILTGNFTGPNAVATGFNTNHQHQFTQELRLQSADSSSALKWVAGAFYQRVDQSSVGGTLQDLGALTQALYGATVEQTFGSPVLPGGAILAGNSATRDTQKAVFGQADLRLLDQLTATAGLRYAKMTYRYRNAQDGPFNGGPTGSTGGSASSFLSPKFGLEYRPVGGLMFYASAAKGFRPGAANTPIASLCAPDLHSYGFASAPAAYDPDHVWSYEAGSKGELLQHRFLWDVSVYDVKWSKQQLGLYLPGCGQTIIANVGTAVSKGFDLQAKFAVSEHLTLEGSLGYDDAYTSQTVANAGAQQNIVTAGELLNTPPWHGFVSAEYEFAPLPHNTRLYLQADDSYTNSYRLGSPQDANYDASVSGAGIEAVNILAARCGIRGESWDVSLFTKNPLNSHPTLGSAYHVSVTSERFEEATLPRRVIGITGIYKF